MRIFINPDPLWADNPRLLSGIMEKVTCLYMEFSRCFT